MSYQVFLSYSYEDHASAGSIAERLRAKGIAVFVAPRSIPPGELFPEEIRRALNGSNEFCLLLTSNAANNHWVLLECGGAFFKGLAVTIIKYPGHSVTVPDVFKQLQWIDPVDIEKYIQNVAQRAAEEPGWIFGSPPKGRVQVIAHCDEQKFRDGRTYRAGVPDGVATGMSAPGTQLYKSLADLLRDHSYAIPLEIKVLGGDNSCNGPVQRDAQAVFFCDSPKNNRLVADILTRYTEWVAGGKLRFTRLDQEGRATCITVEGQGVYAPDKFNLGMDKYLLGPWNDYFVVMKLPGSVVSLSNANAPVWVLFGVTSKGTVAAVKLFGASLRSAFRQDVAERSKRCLVPYFEAVYCVPENVDASDFSFDSVQTVHFSVLRSRKDEATSDEFDWRELRHFVSKTPGRVGLQVAHLDVVAACNFACSGCIETALRNRNLRMSFSALTDILCRLKECGCCKVGFYGGEPTLHPHFPSLIDLAGNMGFEMVIVTNGSQLLKSGDLGDAIIRMQKMLQVRVSIDAARAATHSIVHGVRGEHVFDGIVRGTKQIIDKGVHVSISYLVRPSSVGQTGNIFELREACEFWKANGARQLCIRPMTLPGGSTPDLPKSDERKAVRDVLLAFGDFVSTPDWFRQWLLATNEQCLPPQPKNYRTCYSAFYRVVISPWRRDDPSSQGGRSNGPKETEDAWLSLCSYRRYDPRFGLPLPRNLAGWIQSWERVKCIEQFNPLLDCQDVLCCRDSCNMQIDKCLL